MSNSFKTDASIRGLLPFLLSGLFCVLSIGLVLTVVYIFPLRPVYQAEYWLQDRLLELGRRTAVNDDLILLGVDQPSLLLETVSEEEIASSRGLRLMAEGFPWARPLYAELLDRLCGEGGARLVVIDIFFESEKAGDEELQVALERYADRVVIGSKFEASEPDQDGVMVLSMNLPADSVLPQTDARDPRVGYVTFFPELDDRVRTIQLETTMEAVNGMPEGPDAVRYQSLTAAVLRQLGLTKHLDEWASPRPFRFTKMTKRRVGEKDTYKPHSLYQIFVDEFWDGPNYRGGDYFRDKIVFIGPSASQFQDFHETPFGEMLGVQLHMCAVAAAMADEFYERTSRKADIMLIIAMGVLAWLVVQLVKAPLWRTLLLATAAALYVVAAIVLLNQFDLLVTCVAPLAAYGSSGLLCFAYDFARRVVEELRVRRALERYVSKDLAHEILDNREDYFSALGGTDKAMTMLFSDIRGFTSMTEAMGGKDLVPQLNEYLGEMVEAVFRQQGTLDKFIGDAVMAVWGSVKSEGPKIDTTRAVRSAVEMRDRLAELNAKWEKEGKRPFKIGIGLNHGSAIFGNIGSVERMDPTVIGDAVNLAARLEGLTKTYQCEIIISESVAELVRDEFVLRSVDKVRVKGKTKAVEIFAVVGTAAEIETVPAWLEKHEAAVRAFRQRAFARGGKAIRRGSREASRRLPDSNVP